VTAEQQTFLRVLPTRWRREPAVIDMERIYVTATLCIAFVRFVRDDRPSGELMNNTKLPDNRLYKVSQDSRTYYAITAFSTARKKW